MNFEVTKKEKSQVEIVVKVEGEKLIAYKKDVINNIKKDVEVPGFRKGKAPISVVEEKYADLISQEIADKVMKENYETIVKENDFTPVDYLKLADIKMEETTFTATYLVDVLPSVELGEYKGLEVEKEKYEFNNEELEKEIEGLVSKNSKLKELAEEELAAMDDVVTINFEGFVDGVAFEGGKAENYDLKLGSKSFIDTFEEQIVGHKVGDEFDVNVNFPEQYKEDLAGKEATFKIKINAVKREELPELNDEFAKDLGFDTVDALKEAKKLEIEKRENTKIEHGFVNTVLEKVKAASSVEVPEALVKREASNRAAELESQLKTQGMTLDQYLQMQNMTKDMLFGHLKPLAEEKVKMDLILDEIAKLEGVEVTDEEIEEKMAEVASYYQTEVEKLKEDLKKAGNYDNFIESLKLEKITQKTVDLIVKETVSK